MGKRYIEVFESKYSEMEWVVTRMQGGESDAEAVIRLRGLPYGAQKQDIAEFFAGVLCLSCIVTLFHVGIPLGCCHLQSKLSPFSMESFDQMHAVF